MIKIILGFRLYYGTSWIYVFHFVTTRFAIDLCTFTMHSSGITFLSYKLILCCIWNTGKLRWQTNSLPVLLMLFLYFLLTHHFFSLSYFSLFYRFCSPLSQLWRSQHWCLLGKKLMRHKKHQLSSTVRTHTYMICLFYHISFLLRFVLISFDFWYQNLHECSQTVPRLFW